MYFLVNIILRSVCGFFYIQTSDKISLVIKVIGAMLQAAATDGQKANVMVDYIIKVGIIISFSN